MEEFNITETSKGKIKILNLEGFLDAHTSTILETALNKILDKQEYKIVVNFKNLTYISSAGLGVFMAFIEKVRQTGGDIKLCEMSNKIFNIFDMLGFPLLFEIYKTQEEAIAKFLNTNQQTKIGKNK